MPGGWTRRAGRACHEPVLVAFALCADRGQFPGCRRTVREGPRGRPWRGVRGPVQVRRQVHQGRDRGERREHQQAARLVERTQVHVPLQGCRVRNRLLAEHEDPPRQLPDADDHGLRLASRKEGGPRRAVARPAGFQRQGRVRPFDSADRPGGGSLSGHEPELPRLLPGPRAQPSRAARRDAAWRSVQGGRSRATR